VSATLLEPRAQRVLAIDIGGTKLALGLFEDGRLIQREERPTDRDAGPEGALAAILPVAQALQAEANITSCGVGFGGPVDFVNQRVALSTHVSGWTGFPLRDFLQNKLGVPAIIDNDANVGALGEARFGAGRASSPSEPQALPMFYMTISTGIGGGLVLADGSIYRGANSWAAEIGHMTIRPDGPDCLCGSKGCLERMCCGLWLERDYGKPPRELFEDSGFVERYVRDLALGLKAAIMILNPACIVLGGGIARSGDRLFVPLREELKRQMPPWSGALVDVRPAGLGSDHVLWGAYALATSQSF
jgi:glucokinase